MKNKDIPVLTSSLISPKPLRGVVTAAAGLSYTLGPFIVTLLTNSYGDMDSRWAYRGIFVSQYAVTAAGVIGVPFMPEYVCSLVLCEINVTAEIS